MDRAPSPQRFERNENAPKPFYKTRHTKIHVKCLFNNAVRNHNAKHSHHEGLPINSVRNSNNIAKSKSKFTSSKQEHEKKDLRGLLFFLSSIVCISTHIYQNDVRLPVLKGHTFSNLSGMYSSGLFSCQGSKTQTTSPL